jgi:hypothetical protein
VTKKWDKNLSLSLSFSSIVRECTIHDGDFYPKKLPISILFAVTQREQAKTTKTLKNDNKRVAENFSIFSPPPTPCQLISIASSWKILHPLMTLVIVIRFLCKKVGQKFRYEAGTVLFSSWLPDFSWCNIPRREKIYQMFIKYTNRL